MCECTGFSQDTEWLVPIKTSKGSNCNSGTERVAVGWLKAKVAQERSPCSRRVIFALGTRGRVYAALPIVNARPIQSKI